jgi:hypothetical protein
MTAIKFSHMVAASMVVWMTWHLGLELVMAFEFGSGMGRPLHL